MLNFRPMTGLAMVALALVASAPAYSADTPPEPKILHAPPEATAVSLQSVTLPARRLWAFWNTGEDRFAKETLASDFKDVTPTGYSPLAVKGPVAASQALRQAIPDLAVSVEEAWVSGDQVISRLHFTGHFKGKFGSRKGDGHEVGFDAVDIYQVTEGKIAAASRFQDNLALEKQLTGKAKP